VIEADLQRFYGVRLTDLWTGQLSLRRLRVLLDHLPLDSATAYAVKQPLAGWNLGNALLGRVLDELASYRWQWETAHQSKGPRRNPPESVLPQAPNAPADDAPVVSPHALGGFVNFEEA